MGVSKWTFSILTLLVTYISPVQATDSYYYLGGSFGYSDLAVKDPASSFPPIYSIVFPGIAAINTDSYDVDDTDTVWKVYGGYLFNPYFGLEAGYTDLGAADIIQRSSYVYSESVPGGTDTTTQTYDADINTRIKGFELTAIARYILNENFSIYGKVGGIRVKSKLNRPTSISWSVLMSRTGFPDANQILFKRTGTQIESHNGVDVTFGLGAELAITESFSLRAEWQQYRLHTEWVQHQIDIENNIKTYNLGISYRFGN